jgi:hypothetical protein
MAAEIDFLGVFSSTLRTEHKSTSARLVSGVYYEGHDGKVPKCIQAARGGGETRETQETSGLSVVLK